MPHPVAHAYCADSLGYSDASDLSQKLYLRQISAIGLVQDSYQRLQKVEQKITASVSLRYETALEAAQQFDRHPTVSGFGFIPSFLKDNLDLKGMPTRHGSKATPSNAVGKSSGISKQLESCGLVWMGKSKLPEFGLTATTEFSHGEPARNPWNPEHSTGGSSGGSAALVAAGVVPIAHANDGGGSIRIPASCCGLVGLKPSRGRWVPNEVAKDLPIQIVSDGVLTRTVRDTARLFGFAEKHHLSKSLPSIGHIERSTARKLKIAYFSKLPTGGHTHEDCVQAVEQVAAFFSQSGHRVVQINPPIPENFAEDFLLYWASMASSVNYFGKALFGRKFDAEKLEPLTKQLSKYALKRCLKLPFTLKRLKDFAGHYEQSFDDFDVILSPTLGTPPPKIGHLSLDLPIELAKERLFEFACFTAAQNVSGAPGISLPAMVNANNLPIGIHLAAPLGQDSLLIELAYQLEEAGELIQWMSQ